MLVAYVSGHGFGHAVRVAEVLRVLRARAPELRLAVVTSVPEWLFREALGDGFLYRHVACDVGLVQRDALHIDEPGTARVWQEFSASYPALVEAEARWLTEEGARLILADIPPLAFDAAAAAGIDVVGLGNFSWDWIYRHVAPRAPELWAAAEHAAAAYRRARLLLELPFTGDMSAFPRRESIPLVARRPIVDRAEARRRLGLPDGRLALLSFGGLGRPDWDPKRLRVTGWHLLTTRAWPDNPPGIVAVDEARLTAAGLRYPELIAAADVVVSKPGYGIVTDVMGAKSRLVYTERGDFPEYPILVDGIHRHLPAVHISNADLTAGRLGPALEAVCLEPELPPPDLEGASVAADRLLELLR